MNNKRKMIFCEPCAYKQIIDPKEEPDLVVIPTSPIQQGIPQLDQATGKTKLRPAKPQNKKYKCPKCGRGVVVKELLGAYSSLMKKLDDETERKKAEEDRLQRLKDGMPPPKKIIEDFEEIHEKKSHNP